MTLGLKIITGLFFILGLFLIVMGLMGVNSGNVSTLSGNFIISAGIVLFVSGVVYIIVAYFLWQRNKIAMYAATAIGIINLLTIFLFNFLGLAVGAVTIYYLWIDKKTRKIFR